MTTLAERLRSKEVNSGLCCEAADEIERLRVDCDRLREFNTKLCAEIERLREQLDIARLALSAPMLGDIPQ